MIKSLVIATAILSSCTTVSGPPTYPKPGVERWTVAGEPVQKGWEMVVLAAARQIPAPCASIMQAWGSWTGKITFVRGPFPCPTPQEPGRYCDGLSTGGLIEINGAQTDDVLAGTLPWEMANTVLQLCDNDYSEHRTPALNLLIVQEARRLLGR